MNYPPRNMDLYRHLHKWNNLSSSESLFLHLITVYSVLCINLPLRNLTLNL